MDKLQFRFIKQNRLNILLIIILLFALLFCIIKIDDYGLSYDEITYYDFANVNFHALKNFINGDAFDKLFDFYNLRYYGPAYLLIGNSAVSVLKSIFPTIDVYHVWHVLNLITFLGGAWFLYLLCKRFTSELAAFFASLLYLTQPLLWGHGIMNPKDTPFMVFFLASITLGLTAFDKIKRVPQNTKDRPSPLERRRKTRGTKHTLILIAALLGIIFILSVFDRISSNSLTRPLINQLFEKINNVDSRSILYTARVMISNGMRNGVSFAAYLAKVLRLVNQGEFYFICAYALALSAAVFLRLPSHYRWLIIAGATVGLTAAMRVLGPAAGVLISIYAIVQYKQKAIKFLAVYAGIAVIFMYLFWPYLWLDPVNRFIDVVRVMSNFPWGGTVRFNGFDYLPPQLPWYYLTKMMAIQFTLPVTILTLLGLVSAGIYSIKHKGLWLERAIILAWILVPVILVGVMKPILYDNFRQFLFITPPLFVFSAIAFEKLLNSIGVKWVGLAICSLLIVPGLISGLWLHPYEYVYYNALVGWTGNIERTYENDYYGTSMCEAARYLSGIAKDGAQVAFTDEGLSLMFKDCEANKFQILVERAEKSKISPDYSVVLTRYDDDLDYFRSMKIIKTIQRGKTLFVVIRSK
jgi:hypothetical protein